MKVKASLRWILLLSLMSWVGSSARAQSLQGAALVEALQRGGNVLVMRHASSPSEPPSKEAADAENVRGERQLDQKGQATATAMGKALRELNIPIGEVLSSPTYRALETVKYARLGKPRTYPELGDNGKSMQGGTEAQTHWLRERVTHFPSGTNTLIVTHNPNIIAAFPQIEGAPADGETLVLGRDEKGGATVVARVKIESWASLGR